MHLIALTHLKGLRKTPHHVFVPWVLVVRVRHKTRNGTSFERTHLGEGGLRQIAAIGPKLVVVIWHALRAASRRDDILAMPPSAIVSWSEKGRWAIRQRRKTES